MNDPVICRAIAILDEAKAAIVSQSLDPCSIDNMSGYVDRMESMTVWGSTLDYFKRGWHGGGKAAVGHQIAYKVLLGAISDVEYPDTPRGPIHG